MYAIFETGGKQYKVQAGDKVRVEKLAGEAGDKVSFDTVIAYSDGGAFRSGAPYIEGASVDATILQTGKGEKVVIFKFKAKKDYRKKQGHRQPFTEVEIDGFTIDGKSVGEKPVKAKKAPKKEEAPVVAEDVKVEEPVVEAEDVKVEDPVVEEEVVEAEEPEVEVTADEPVEEMVEDVKEAIADAAPPKMTKADIMAKLDELGATYKKSSTKDELLQVLAEAEK
jgi:large subunit ribosomal protein L21